MPALSRCIGLAFCHIIYSLKFWVTNSILWLSLRWEWQGQSPAGRSLETRDWLWLQPLSVWQDRSGARWGPRWRKTAAQITSTLLCDCGSEKRPKGGGSLRFWKSERDMLREILNIYYKNCKFQDTVRWTTWLFHKLEGNVIHNCNLLEILLALSEKNLPH